MMKKCLGLVAVVAAMGTVSHGRAANTVQKTADNCQNAHAVLMAGADGAHSRYWEAIKGVITSSNGVFQLVSDDERGVSQKVSLRQYDTRFTQGGTAYVAHCGHGGTCNELAEAVLKHYPESGSPSVWCGEVPHILDNPQAPSL